MEKNNLPPKPGDLWSGSWTVKPDPWKDVPFPGDFWMEMYPNGIPPITWRIVELQSDRMILEHAGGNFPVIVAPLPKDWKSEYNSFRWLPSR